jgi:hypothetical protein
MNELAARRTQADQDDEGPIPQSVIDEVKAKHPGIDLKLLTVENDGVGGAAIFRSPTKGEYKRWRSMMIDPAQRLEGNEAIVFGCLVYPSVAELRNLFEKRPGFADTWADKLTDWAGGGQRVTEKKL